MLGPWCFGQAFLACGKLEIVAADGLVIDRQGLEMVSAGTRYDQNMYK